MACTTNEPVAAPFPISKTSKNTSEVQKRKWNQALNNFKRPLRDKYKYMESNLSQRRKGLEEKIPDIKKTLAMGDGIDDPMTTTFELNDTLWAEASIEQIDEVYLWLGANVMLAYPIQEAITLLTAKLQAAQRNHKGIVDDLEFLREQITIMEVNTARVYNYDVRRRREKKASEDK
ncbi:related to prefoldin subunit 3 [Serendipita indica DSM 11827]|uniref:Prefoldin subunit 3 n=1 Tax=Serendipita indica (strain DSM 11827) TaxID=1109443 RepID=G4T574_SERID|nr:related to prefoldin subunit 3 [Serendipita indica DSM 11827]